MAVLSALAVAVLLSSGVGEGRDPYQSYLDAVGAPEEGQTALERIPLDRLRLTGVVLGTAPQALLEDSGGMGHFVRIGTAVGTGGGRVTAILQDRVVVETRLRDAIGRVSKHTTSLPLARAR